jgi:hypothetical protein
MLAAETSYQCWAYAEDKYGNFTPAPADTTTYTFTTSALPEAQRLAISFTTTTQTLVAESNKDNFVTYIAETFGVQPERLINFAYASTAPTDSTNGSASFTWDIPALRCMEGPTPADLMSLDSSKTSMLSTKISGGGVTNTPSYNLSAISFFTAPTWSTGGTPSQSGTSTTTGATL